MQQEQHSAAAGSNTRDRRQEGAPGPSDTSNKKEKRGKKKTARVMVMAARFSFLLSLVPFQCTKGRRCKHDAPGSSKTKTGGGALAPAASAPIGQGADATVRVAHIDRQDRAVDRGQGGDEGDGRVGHPDASKEGGGAEQEGRTGVAGLVVVEVQWMGG
jgi:hypothetical protein